MRYDADLGQRLVSTTARALCRAAGQDFDKAPPVTRIELINEARHVILAFGAEGLMLMEGETYAKIVQGHGGLSLVRETGEQGESTPVDSPDLCEHAPSPGAHTVSDKGEADEQIIQKLATEIRDAISDGRTSREVAELVAEHNLSASRYRRFAAIRDESGWAHGIYP